MSTNEIPGLQTFFDAYVTAALWSSDGPDDEPLDKNYDENDLSDDCKRAMLADCTEFLTRFSALIGKRFGQAGHDFWLTRNGHGCGFWETRDWDPIVGATLTLSCQHRGVYLYVGGDDDEIHCG